MGAMGGASGYVPTMRSKKAVGADSPNLLRAKSLNLYEAPFDKPVAVYVLSVIPSFRVVKTVPLVH